MAVSVWDRGGLRCPDRAADQMAVPFPEKANTSEAASFGGKIMSLRDFNYVCLKGMRNGWGETKPWQTQQQQRWGVEAGKDGRLCPAGVCSDSGGGTSGEREGCGWEGS